MIGLFVLYVFCLLLSLPALKRDCEVSVVSSLFNYLFASLKSLFGILIPLIAFGLSVLFTPEWTGAVKNGWIDCFFIGKLALIPLVLWATASLYFVEVIGVIIYETWVILGLFMGLLVSAACLIHGLIFSEMVFNNRGWFSYVPIYVPMWYAVRFIMAASKTDIGWKNYCFSIIGSSPLWFLSYYISNDHCSKLPIDAPKNCYVVTAASKGHAFIVGPSYEVVQGGRVNEQMLVLWRFEVMWAEIHKSSHRAFRRLYNRYGYAAANLIKSRWQADIAYLSIKPVEVFAKLSLLLHEQVTRHTKQK